VQHWTVCEIPEQRYRCNAIGERHARGSIGMRRARGHGRRRPPIARLPSPCQGTTSSTLWRQRARSQCIDRWRQRARSQCIDRTQMATGAAAFQAERGSGEAQCVPTFLIEVIVLLHDEVANAGSKEAGAGGEGRRQWAPGEESQIGAAAGTGCGGVIQEWER
jgi:hypothetical protein